MCLKENIYFCVPFTSSEIFLLTKHKTEKYILISFFYPISLIQEIHEENTIILVALVRIVVTGCTWHVHTYKGERGANAILARAAVTAEIICKVNLFTKSRYKFKFQYIYLRDICIEI